MQAQKGETLAQLHLPTYISFPFSLVDSALPVLVVCDVVTFADKSYRLVTFLKIDVLLISYGQSDDKFKNTSQISLFKTGHYTGFQSWKRF